MQRLIEFIWAHWILVSLLILLFILIVYAEWSGAANGLRLLSPQQLVMHMNREKTIIIDLRVPELYKKGHILGALNVTLEDFPQYVSTLSKAKSRHAIVLYGFEPSKMDPAINALRKSGFKQLLGIKGGIQRWQGEGLPLDKH